MTGNVIKKYNIRAKKSLGQNFLVDEEILTQISSFLSVQGKNIIEVGPGYGALTSKILEKKPLSLTLVELDEKMVNIIQDRILKGELMTGGIEFEIINQDVLKFTPVLQKYSVVANIPYYITSPILRHFIYDVENTPESMLILMQKDVGDKILGGKKNKSSVIRLFVIKKYSVEEVVHVPKESFVPAPKVESSVLLFQKHDLYTDIDEGRFMEIIKIGFSSNRKKLVSNLVAGGLEKNKVLSTFKILGFDENSRGEELDIGMWCSLIKAL